MQSLESLNDDSYLVLTSEDINVIEKFNTEEPEQAKVQHAVFEDHPVAYQETRSLPTDMHELVLFLL